jgi:DNA polymerase-3 subunit epsilon
MKILYIDVETTGLNPVKNGIHQIAGIIEINEKLIDTFDFKVKPFPDDIIVDNALKVSGTTREDLKNYYETEEVINMFMSIIHNYFSDQEITYLCGHNVQFDFNFVNEWLRKFGIYGFSNFQQQICTKKMAQDKQLEHGYKDNKLITVADHFGYNFNAHDAMEDIKATRFIHHKLDTIYYNDLF